LAVEGDIICSGVLPVLGWYCTDLGQFVAAESKGADSDDRVQLREIQEQGQRYPTPLHTHTPPGLTILDASGKMWGNVLNNGFASPPQ